MSETHAISVEKLLPYPPERVWRTLTKSDLIAKWLMPNDFEPVVGYVFTFQTRPMGAGTASCSARCCNVSRRGCCAIPGRAARMPIRITARASIRR